MLSNFAKRRCRKLLNTFVALLPVYATANLHCLGMCGPLVMMLSQHRYRFLYFLGRLISFTTIGGLAGLFGAVLRVHFSPYLIMGIGVFFVLLGALFLMGKSVGKWIPIPAFFEYLGKRLSLLILQDGWLPPFLFGMGTVLLPCGQTILVFSACGLSGSAFVGLFNGAFLAVITSPSLWLAMQAKNILSKWRGYEGIAFGLTSIAVGSLSVLRGLASLGVIEHLFLYKRWHFVIY